MSKNEHGDTSPHDRGDALTTSQSPSASAEGMNGSAPGMTTDAVQAMEFARTALARARAHARGAGRAHWRGIRNSQRLASTADPDDPVFSGAGPDRRDPTSAAVILEELISRNGWSQERTVANVTSRWSEIVGPDVAAHVSIETFAVMTDMPAPMGPAESPKGRAANEGRQGTTVPQGRASSMRSTDPVAQIVLRADSTAWATQMRLLLPALRERISAELGEGLGLAIRVLGPAAPSWRHGQRRVAGRGPRDTYG